MLVTWVCLFCEVIELCTDNMCILRFKKKFLKKSIAGFYKGKRRSRQELGHGGLCATMLLAEGPKDDREFSLTGQLNHQIRVWECHGSSMEDE